MGFYSCMTQALRFSSGSTIEPVAKLWYLIMRRNARNFVDNFVWAAW